ncbi:MAG: isochorismate synthase MenF [Actinomycetes bacterium]
MSTHPRTHRRVVARVEASLVARTVAVPDPGPLLSRLPQDAPAAWVRRGEGLVGWGEAVRVRLHGPGRFAQADEAWRELVAGAVVRDDVSRPGSGPVAFASFSFSDQAADGGVLVVPEVALGHRDGAWWLTTVTAGATIPTLPGLTEPPPPRLPAQVRFADGARPGPQWMAVVAEAVQHIADGRVDKVVLARDLVAEADEPVDVRCLLTRLAERYPTCWTFTVDGLTGATPELLVRRERGLVTSRVLAGTIRRTGDDEHDLALAASLARSSKDLEEHEYAVRSVAEALAPHLSSANVPDSPFVLLLPNVMHLATDVTGVLRSSRDGASPTAIGLAEALHPTAAVCGTPTAEAADLIAELEGMDRGRYAGPVGWIDASGDGEFGIALRCAQVDAARPQRLRLFAGCGIVAGSDPAAELAESDAKLVPMRDALG